MNLSQTDGLIVLYLPPETLLRILSIRVQYAEYVVFIPALTKLALRYLIYSLHETAEL